MTTPDHLVHGLAGDDIKAAWPPLQLTELNALLQLYPSLRGALRINWHSPRPLSAACLVDTEGGQVFVKRHHRNVRDAAELEREHALIAHLHRAGMSVAPLYADACGDTAIEIGDWTYEVQQPAQGHDAFRDTPSWQPLSDHDQAFETGHVLARMHDALEQFDAPQRATHLLVARSELIQAADPIAALQAQLPGRAALAAYLARHDWRNELRRSIEPWHAKSQSRLAVQKPMWTHGDWHVSNLFWSADGRHISTILDFNLAARTFALFDLATAIERNAIAWLELEKHADIGHADIAIALLAGYHAQRPLSAEQRLLLADLLPLVHVDFALSEIEYFSDITRVPAHADIAWRDFLLGHAAWFSTPPGRALLAAIGSDG